MPDSPNPRKVNLWLRWRWHRLRYCQRDATWHSIHSYGCDACEAHDG